MIPHCRLRRRRALGPWSPTDLLRLHHHGRGPVDPAGAPHRADRPSRRQRRRQPVRPRHRTRRQRLSRCKKLGRESPWPPISPIRLSQSQVPSLTRRRHPTASPPTLDLRRRRHLHPVSRAELSPAPTAPRPVFRLLPPTPFHRERLQPMDSLCPPPHQRRAHHPYHLIPLPRRARRHPFGAPLSRSRHHRSRRHRRSCPSQIGRRCLPPRSCGHTSRSDSRPTVTSG